MVFQAMSQSKVNSFFLQRKGIRDGHAAKRRKLDGSSNNVNLKIAGTQEHCERPQSSVIQGSCFSLQQAVPVLGGKPSPSQSTPASESDTISNKSRIGIGKKENQINSKPTSISTSKSRSRTTLSRSRKTVNVKDNRRQQKLTDFKLVSSQRESQSLESQPGSSDLDLDQASENLDLVLVPDQRQSAQKFEEQTKSKSKEYRCQYREVEEEITSIQDDHLIDNLRPELEGMSTPRKEVITEGTLTHNSQTQGPQNHRRKTALRRIIRPNNEDEIYNTNSQLHDSSKSKNVICRKLDLDQVVQVDKRNSDEKYKVTSEGNFDTNTSRLKVCGKTELLAAVSEISDTQDAISPLAMTPEHPSSSFPQQESSPKLQNLSAKLQALSKMDGKALKNRLKQKGLLNDFREKCASLTKAVRENDDLNSQLTSSPADVSHLSKSEDKEEEKRLPAYQRFDYLARDGPPTLNLPYSYRLLENAFQAMDTAVSMLHNRSEICTFSKLKSAVQIQTRKNFEQRTVGQIKTVIPDGYVFRQEKNIPLFGQKASGYQLTIEANLQDQGSNTNFTKDGKASFTVKHIQQRKEYFKQRLLYFVKQHHKKFLESLNPPLRIPDSKLSRWHPKFRLDDAPEIPVADLPQPPDAKICHSAKDVLEIMKRGNINPLVERALQKVVAEKDASLQHKINETSGNKCPSSPATPSCSKQTTSSLKGIPPALLAKIREKESRKMEAALTRDPAEDRKTTMMGHLPEIIRILRSYFVTEKKAALPLGVVFKKLEDSYKSGMALGDIGPHINLLKELAPEFVSIVEIKKGKYLKLDKNVDITSVSSRITNILKSRK